MGRMLAVVVVALVGSSAQADDYYVTIFAAESVPYRPDKTHTFLAVTRVPCAGVPETYEIGWLAATTHIRGFAALPEPGKNFTVAESLAVCRRDEMRVSVWGPYRIKEELFDRLRDQSMRLSSGRIKYKGTDNLYPSCVAMNCYHAIWNVTDPLRKHSGPFTAGQRAAFS